MIGLPPAGHRVADTRARSRVHVLHHDKGMFLQRGHSQVTIIRHLVQEAAVAGPDRVAHLKDPSSVRAHLQGKDGHCLSRLSLFTFTSITGESLKSLTETTKPENGEKSITLTIRPIVRPFSCCKPDRTDSDLHSEPEFDTLERIKKE